jgi:lipoprotein-releasing system ATP-binding protein
MLECGDFEGYLSVNEVRRCVGVVFSWIFCIFVVMITMSNIRKSYGSLEVLRDLSLEVPDGRVTCIVGPSGSGKSTLLHILGTLDRPDAGVVSYDGVCPYEYGDNKLSRFRGEHIGFVFQNHRLLPEFSIQENVAIPAMILGVKRKESMERARVLLSELGLGDRLNHRPSELSGGECQRASVARALVNNPKVVLADEPSGSLDSENRASLHRLFFDLRDKYGTTFVIVTHDEHLASMSDRTIHLADGRVTACIDNSL